MLLLGSAASTARAQEEIDPDRPDVTNGTHIVGVGQWQVEFGGIYARNNAVESAFGSPLTVRLGLRSWLEARFGTDGLLTVSNGDGRETGVGNLQVGAKVRLWADPGGAPVLSVLPVVTLPTASADKGLGSGDADFTIALLTGRDVGENGHVDVNYGIGAIGSGDERSRFVQHLVSVSASVTAGQHWNPYAEGFWFSRQDIDSGATTAIDLGAIYRFSPRLAADGGAQFGLSDAAPGFAVFGGLSMLVGDGGGDVRQRDRRVHATTARPAGRR